MPATPPLRRDAWRLFLSDAYQIISFRGGSLPKDYEPLIYTSWLRALRYGNEHLRDVKASQYYPRYHDYIAGIISAPQTEIRLAVLTDDDDVVLGYSVSRGIKLDFVWVQKHQRRQGIGTALTPDVIEEWTDPLTPFRDSK
jgi:hypothetical protein